MNPRQCHDVFAPLRVHLNRQSDDTLHWKFLLYGGFGADSQPASSLGLTPWQRLWSSAEIIRTAGSQLRQLCKRSVWGYGDRLLVAEREQIEINSYVRSRFRADRRYEKMADCCWPRIREQMTPDSGHTFCMTAIHSLDFRLLGNLQRIINFDA